MSGNPIPLVTDDMNLFTLMIRLRVRLEEDDPANLAWIIPDILMRCQSGVDEPNEVLEIVQRLAKTCPDLGRRWLLDALEREIDSRLLVGLVELLESLGANLVEREADALSRLRDLHPGERVHAMYLLCALGPTTDEGCRAVLESDLGRLWRLEQARIESLWRQTPRALPACIEALHHDDETVRARAEAALEAMGPMAVAATKALLEMPPWEEDHDRASPALFSMGEAAIPALTDGLKHPSPRARYRAQQVLELLNASTRLD